MKQSSIASAIKGATYDQDFAEILADVKALREKLSKKGYQLGLDENNDCRLVLLPKGFDCSNACLHEIGETKTDAMNMAEFVETLPDLVSGDPIYILRYGNAETCWKVSNG
jgi:hypothetical protein